MNDSRLVQGLVIGSCIFLAFAVLMTWADVLGYRETADLGTIPQAPKLSSLVEAVPAPGRRPGAPVPAGPAAPVDTGLQPSRAPEEEMVPPAEETPMMPGLPGGGFGE